MAEVGRAKTALAKRSSELAECFSDVAEGSGELAECFSDVARGSGELAKRLGDVAKGSGELAEWFGDVAKGSGEGARAAARAGGGGAEGGAEGEEIAVKRRGTALRYVFAYSSCFSLHLLLKENPMPSDYLPNADAAFLTWATNFGNNLAQFAAALGILPADDLNVELGAYTAALGALTAAQSAARTARQAKEDARAALEEHVRSLARRVQANPATTDQMRVALGLTVAGAAPTMAAATSLEGHRVSAWVDTAARLQHTIHFADISTPRSKAKPKGIKGCEIWRKIGTPPALAGGAVNPADLEFVALDTATPYVAEYASDAAGKTVYYVLRWVTNNDLKGPWSETVEATVVG